MDADALLGGLDEEQRVAVTSPAAPLAILAGAGAGKTRVLTRRIAWRAATGALDPDRVLAVTFTRRAAGELRARLDALAVASPVTAATIHALALAQLQAHHTDPHRSFPGVLARKARLLVPLTGRRGADARVAAAALGGEIEWAKARLVPPDRYEDAVARAARTPPQPASRVAAVYERYEREKRRRGLVDFDDLLWWCADRLETDPRFAAGQRWRYRHLFVDEFQDVSPAQLRVVRGWLGDRADLCVAGDPDQAIYGFAGAEPRSLTGFTTEFPGGAVVRLSRNYRSTPQVVGAAHGVLGPAGRGRPAPVAVRPGGPAPTVTSYPTEEDEARGVARRLLEERHGAVPWSALAVLYRTNAQSAPFEAALEGAGIPYRVRGAGTFLRRPEVRAALDTLRSGDRAAPGRPFADHLLDLVELSGAASTTPEQADHVAVLARLGREYLHTEPGLGSLGGFEAYLHAALRDDNPDEGADAVELLTFHRAKGLEFRVVFVTGLERGLVPIGHAATPATRAEERRLLYVALTRAELAVHCSWSVSRTVGARRQRRVPSPWLAAIGAAADTPGVPSRPARVDLSRLRAQLRGAGAPPVADPLLGALRAWRDRTARGAGVPARVVLGDDALHALAAARPTTVEALRAVPGLDPLRAARHGPAILRLVGDGRSGGADPPPAAAVAAATRSWPPQG